MRDTPKVPDPETRELLRRADEVTEDLEKLAKELASGARNTDLEGRQTFSVEWTPQQLKAASQQHKQILEAEERRHQLDQATKDNEAKRGREKKAEESRLRRESVTYYSVLIVILGSLVTSGIVGFNSKNTDARGFAQDAFLLILGGLIGAMAGYFTGKSGSR